MISCVSQPPENRWEQTVLTVLTFGETDTERDSRMENAFVLVITTSPSFQHRPFHTDALLNVTTLCPDWAQAHLVSLSASVMDSLSSVHLYSSVSHKTTNSKQHIDFDLSAKLSSMETVLIVNCQGFKLFLKEWLYCYICAYFTAMNRAV